MALISIQAAGTAGAPAQPKPGHGVVEWLARAVALPRGFALIVVSLAALGCADAPTGPLLRAPILDPIPAVADASGRLVPVLENVGVRQRILHDLGAIESALRTGDAQRARYHTRLAANILLDYRVGIGSVTKDGPDVTAIALALHAVAKAVGSDFDVSAFR